MRIIRRDQKPDGKYEINSKRDSGLYAVPNNSADRLLAESATFESDDDIFRFGDLETTCKLKSILKKDFDDGKFAR